MNRYIDIHIHNEANSHSNYIDGTITMARHNDILFPGFSTRTFIATVGFHLSHFVTVLSAARSSSPFLCHLTIPIFVSAS